jgi:hypothetical protein
MGYVIRRIVPPSDKLPSAPPESSRLAGHPGLACTAAGASEDNTIAVYTEFLFGKKEWLQNSTDEVVWFKIYTGWTIF